MKLEDPELKWYKLMGIRLRKNLHHLNLKDLNGQVQDKRVGFVQMIAEFLHWKFSWKSLTRSGFKMVSYRNQFVGASEDSDDDNDDGNWKLH